MRRGSMRRQAWLAAAVLLAAALGACVSKPGASPRQAAPQTAAPAGGPSARPAAGAAPTVTVENATGQAGASVVVRVLLRHCATAAGYAVTLNWDASKLKLVEGSALAGADLAGALFTANGTNARQLSVAAAGAKPFTATAGGGASELLRASFQIVAPSAAGTRSSLAISRAVLTDTAGNAVPDVASVPGEITTR